MMRSRRLFLAAVMLVCIVAGSLYGDVSTRGQVEGRVTTSDGSALPGATLSLSSPVLVAGSVVEIADSGGAFRFVNLSPGRYQLRVELNGFAPRQYDIDVHVGKTTTIDAAMTMSSVAETITVTAAASLFDQTSAAHGTNMGAEELELLPSNRNFIDNVDAAAGFNNQAAYGAGGNVATYDRFGYGAATNSYQLNGVSISNLEYGNSWVNPNYDTIQEIQIVGPGGSAEYSSYSGAVVNVVTKAGTSQFGGTVAAHYTSDSLTADNSDGISDLEPDTIDRDTEFSATFGGPLIPEKLHFFAAGAYHTESTAPARSAFFDDLDRKQYQLRLDFVPSKSHTIAGMLNREPIQDKNLGLEIGGGPELGYFREQTTTSGFVSWLGSWSDDWVTELRYAGVSGFHDRLPNSLEKARVTDTSTGRNYNSAGIVREQENTRDEARAVVTHYVDDFLGASHEVKGGLEYEKAETTTLLSTAEGAIYSLIPVTADITYIQAVIGYTVNQTNNLDRTGAFVQDRATFGKATISAGVRFDGSETFDTNTGKKLLSFDQVSPRLGLTFDVAGNGRSIARFGAGRYYDKTPTYGIGSYAGTGLGAVGIYLAPAFEPLDPTNTARLREIAVHPEFLLIELGSDPRPVEDGIRGPHADIFNVGFDQQIGADYAVSLNYIYRKNEDFIVVTNVGEPFVFAPVTITHEFTGKPFTFYEVVGGGPEEYALGNNDFNYQKTHFAVAELRGRPFSKLFFDASVAWERTRGTRDNNECAILSLCSVGTYHNPNFEQNPFLTEGALSQERPLTIKVRGNWQLPAQMDFGWDMRWMQGRPYGAVDDCFRISDCSDAAAFTIPLEPKDARREDNSFLLNLRMAKSFAIRGIETTLSLDALNVLNELIDPTTYSINTNINSTYVQQDENGVPISSFGRPGGAGTPRQFRFGVRVAF